MRSLLLGAILSLCVAGSAPASSADAHLDADHDLLAANGQAEGVAVVINEFLASNGGYVVDPQGQADDWIELYNPGDAPVDVGGLYLTDDLAVPTKWQVPTDNPNVTTLPPHGYLLIWADDDVGDPGLHAAFALSAGGEDLALFDADGATLVDRVSFDRQMTDVSYGRFPDGTDTWSTMVFPTPGGPNIRIFQGFVAEPEISPDHGFCNSEILVTLTCQTEGAMIYYTTDGSEPYAPGRQVPSSTAGVYTEPLRVGKTTSLRAVGVKSGWSPSPTETRTYLFVDDVIGQSPHGEAPGRGWPSGGVGGQTMDYGMDPDVVNDPRYKDLMDEALLAIPSISLVTELGNLFDPQEGIYVNARSLGRGWERPVSVELIHPDGTEGFQVDAGLRIRGGYSRSGGNPKHAFRLFFRNEYGTPKLQYPLFGDEGVDEFENIDLRTSQNYSWSFEGNSGSSRDTFVREVFSRDTQRDMGQPYTRSRYYHLYINGHYWGLFQTQERSEASYAESYFGGNKDDYDVIKSRAGNGGYDIEATDGTLDAWRRLWDITGSGFDNDESYYGVQGLNPDGTPNPEYEKLLDVDNLIDYMLCTYYVGDPDGPVSAWARVANNFYAVYNRVNPDGFKFFRHDAEHSLYDLHESRLFAASTVAVGGRFNQSNPLWLHTHLVAHPEYRMRFADRAHKYFFNAGVLTPEQCRDRFMARAAEIDMVIIAESARWGDAKRSRPRTKDDDWLPDINRMVSNYLPSRTGVVLNQLKSQGWYPGANAPAFDVNGSYQHGGYVASGDLLSMTGGAGAIWYTLDGSEPRVPGTVAGPAEELTLASERAAKRVLVPDGPVGDAWKGGQAFDDSGWISGTGGVGFERSAGYEPLFDIDVQSQMYGRNATCYIRIPFNVSAADLGNLSNLLLKVRYDDGFVAYLNGVEVQRAMFDGVPTWDSAAYANHSDADAVNFETFNITGDVDKLRPGANLLAIHAMNSSSTSSDFLISVELASSKGPVGGVQTGVSPTAVRYTDPIPLRQSVRVKARALAGATWSALNEAVFAVGPVAESLRISELMYHPVDTGHPDDPNTEYIELTNIADETVNLNLVKFTNGIDFTFPSLELAPGGYCLVVKDLAAFEARYGPGFNVTGPYAGRLNNAGERIELEDAVGQVIHNFRFRDGWYDETDGRGYSLEVVDPAGTDPNEWDMKSAWRASRDVGGSPGSDGAGG